MGGSPLPAHARPRGGDQTPGEGASTSGLSAIKRSSVALEAVTQIKQMIIRGELMAGQQLPTERELADMLGVSRPTIRESIRALVALRIVEPVQGAGTYVSSLEPELLAEPIDFLLQVNIDALSHLFDTRVVLEAGLARLAGSRATDENIEALEAIIAKHVANIDDTNAAVELDLAFHSEVARAAHSPILASLLASISALGRASRTHTGRDIKVRKQAHDDHESILSALRARDPDRTEQAMVKHLQYVRKNL
jgi:GntR family transcriptional repressor for pyruvate dehydrogenase complex